MTLKERRLAAGLRQEDVAKKMGVEQSTVCRWDSGSTPSKPYRKKLARLYKCTVDELLAPGKEDNDVKVVS